MERAVGSFEVELTPQPLDQTAAPSITRMLLDKTFAGDLAATGVGQMVAMRTDIEGSAGYVAMECVSGTLHGRPGTFVLQHHGVMNRGDASLSVTVVPDSGTGALTGIVGEMEIEIDDGAHRYEFTYSLG